MVGTFSTIEFTRGLLLRILICIATSPTWLAPNGLRLAIRSQIGNSAEIWDTFNLFGAFWQGAGKVGLPK